MPDKKCNILSSHLAQIDALGYVYPCCKFEYLAEDIRKDSWLDYKVQNLNSLDGILVSDKWKDFRQRMLKEDIAECSHCWRQENSKITSLRTESNKTKIKQKNIIQSLEISLDTTCNMMCRICKPSQSSKWASADRVLKELTKIDSSRYNKSIVDMSTKDHLQRVIFNSNLKNLRLIKINGGEPFYSKNLVPLLDKIEKDAGIKNVQLEFNTNGSIFPNKEILDMLSMAKKIKIEFSIDATDKLAEVIRYGQSWKTIQKTIRKWLAYFSDATFTIHTTISLLNLNHLNNLIHFTNNLNLNWTYDFLTGPDYLSVYQLPKRYREHLFNVTDQKYKTLLYNELITPQKIPSKFNNFLKSCEILDGYYGNSFEEVNSEIYNLVKKINKPYVSFKKIKR